MAPHSKKEESQHHGHGGHGHGKKDDAHGHGHGHGKKDGGHGHGHGHGHRQSAKVSLVMALVLTFGFMLVEVSVGWYSGSLALLADAGHMLADAGALGLALIAQHFADKPRTERSTFGLRRAEVLAAFVNGIALAAASIWIFKEALERWMFPVPIHGKAMLLTAGGGLCVNLLVAAILMRGDRSLNVRAALAHVLSDAFGSVGAIAAGMAVMIWGITRADPLISSGIALLVAYSGWRVLRETTGILLEAVPAHLNAAAIERSILDCPGVSGVHDLHVWRISERFDTLTAHVTIARGSHGTDVCKSVAERLKLEYGLDHVTIQPEAPPPDELVAVRASKDGAPIR